MARTPLMENVLRAAADVAASEVDEGWRTTRAGLLRRAGVAGLGVASFARLAAPARAASSASVVVVGAGLAGLTCAYRLRQAGYTAQVHEAATRLGGRCWSGRGFFADGQIYEHGGELIDQGHTELRNLAHELGLDLDNLHQAEASQAEVLGFFDGAAYTVAAMSDDLKKVWQKLHSDLSGADYPTLFDSYTQRGFELDHMSIVDWIEESVPGGMQSRLGQLLDVAYNIEYGAESSVQSSLNLVYLLGYLGPGQFRLFGKSNEKYHVRGGNDQVPTRLAGALAGQITTGSELVAVKRTPAGAYTLTFRQGSRTKTVSADKVVVNKMMLGCGFGRRGIFQDFVRQAVLIAKEVSEPVKLVWTREEDTRHGFYRPVASARMTAGLDADGIPIAWKIRTSGQSIIAAVSPRVMQFGVDRNFLQGLLEDMPYHVPNYRVDFAMRNTHVPVGVWRSVNHSQNAFFKESFVDEMAYAAGADPYLFRRTLLAQKPKELAVLDAAAARAEWGSSLPPGVFRGIALHDSQSSICAQVVEASVDEDGEVRVHRVISAIDAGHVVNPLSVEMQTESAIVFGLTATLYGEITIKHGQVEQSNFHDYPMLRLADMPRVETVIVPSEGFWGGAGETPVPPLAPALCNAIFAATGKRIRSLPLKNHDLRSA